MSKTVTPTLMMGHKLIWMIQVTPIIVVVSMTPRVTVVGTVTWFGPR